ncbi:MAG: flavodoxin [Bacteroidales bacterium]|nr:flavodoxin [Bacteroidales bacterium]MCF8388015.1 flavodoxin [Bacteroidales bacterium]MCF8398300.1 flavodoxin [Bacteroidales bacterium]
MAKVGIFYGSSTGNTEFIAEKIKKYLDMENVELFNVDSTEKNDIENCDYLILGTSTWGVGDMQDDWDDFAEIFKDVDLSGKKVALFGLGDQEVYAESFLDGMGHLYNLIKEKTIVVGHWPTTGYRFENSVAVRKNKFVGLAIDQDNEASKSDERIKKWVEELKKEFK